MEGSGEGRVSSSCVGPLLALAAFVLCALAFSPAAALAAGGSISGKVTEAISHDPIDGIEVCALTLNPTFSEESEEEATGESGCAKTGATGEYAITGLNAGSYEVAFLTPPGSPLNFVLQYFDGKGAESEATPVTVLEGADTPDIGAELETGAKLSGTLTLAGTGAGLEGAEVCAGRLVSPGRGEAVACTETGAGGAYTLAGVPGGSIYILFIYVGHEELGIEFLGGGKGLSEATPITVAPKEVRGGLDQALTLVHLPTGQAPSSGSGETAGGAGSGAGARGPSSGFTVTAARGLSLADTHVAVGRGGDALVKVTCSGRARCHGKLALRERRAVERRHRAGSAIVTIGEARYSVEAGGSATVQIKLDSTGRRELRSRRGKLAFHLSIVQIAPSPKGVSVKDVVLVEGRLRRPVKRQVEG
ncbi:MAG: collagen binding domain-containing protein [Solirubrobacteraceae bacterium]